MKLLDKLPENQKKWETYAEQHGVLHMNIHSLDLVDSASKIKDKQFYALRVLWQKQRDLPSGQVLCDERFLPEARRFLREKQAWTDYLTDIRKSIGSSSLSTLEDIGTFSLVRYNQMLTHLSPLADPNNPVTNDQIDSFQRKVVPSPIAHRTRSHQPNLVPPESPKTPTPAPRIQTEREPLDMTQLSSSLCEIEESQLSVVSQDSNIPPSPESPANAAETLPSEDEQIVNMALILFLNCVTIHHPKIKRGGSSSPRWTMKRLQLRFGSWEARTDGFLMMASDKNEVRAILGTKPYVRDQNSNGIQKQESAQMAAWIYQCPDDEFSGSGNDGQSFR